MIFIATFGQGSIFGARVFFMSFRRWWKNLKSWQRGSLISFLIIIFIEILGLIELFVLKIRLGEYLGFLFFIIIIIINYPGFLIVDTFKDYNLWESWPPFFDFLIITLISIVTYSLICIMILTIKTKYKK